MDGNSELVAYSAAGRRRMLLRRGRLLEGTTLGWNVVGIVVLVIAAIGARLVALAGLALHAATGLWWADPLAALVIVFYALTEAREIFLPGLLASRDAANAREAP
jgi:hypothetical protein